MTTSSTYSGETTPGDEERARFLAALAANEQSPEQLEKFSDPKWLNQLTSGNIARLTAAEEELTKQRGDFLKKYAPTRENDNEGGKNVAMNTPTEFSMLKSDKELVAKGAEILTNAPQLHVCVDIESDGIAGYGSMLSIGAATVNGESFFSEIRPASDLYRDDQRQFCEENGLERERLLAEAPDFKTVMHDFHDWVSKMTTELDKEAVFSGVFAGFDWSFVDLYFQMSGLKSPFVQAPLDIKSLAMSLSGDWDWIKTKKSNLPAEIIPDAVFTHNPLDDARYQLEVLCGLVATMSKKESNHSPLL